jgi:dipeptidyl-peptidase-3
MRYGPLLAAIAIMLNASCSHKSPCLPKPQARRRCTETTTPARKYLLEKVDDAAVVQVYADGFDKLPLRDKTLLWHLYQAAIAGRDIYYDQRHRNALEMRAIIEAVVSHPQGIDAATLDEIRRYTKLFWLNTGPYNNLTARKFVLSITPEAFTAAVKKAAGNGATIPSAAGESLDAMLTRLQPMFFDLNVDAIVTNRAPGPGRDMLSASANNFYAGGVTRPTSKASRKSTG